MPCPPPRDLPNPGIKPRSSTLQVDSLPSEPLGKLKLKLLQHFGHLMRRADSLEKTLMLGKIEGKKRRGWQRMRCLDSITDYMDMNLRKQWEMAKDRGAWHATVHRSQSQARLSDQVQHPRLDRKRLSSPNRLLNACTRSDKVYLTRLKCGFCFSRQHVRS